MMTLDEAFAHALDGNALLFLGAGFSRGATNQKGIELRLGSELTTFLAKQSDAPDGAGLEDAAESYISKHGASTLVEELCKEYTVAGISAHHTAIAGVPWMRVYTTNYDNAFEFASELAGKAVQCLTSEADPFSLHPKQLASIHLNGYVKQLTPEALNNSFRLTETSYITASLEDSPWATRLREDSRLARAVFFVGYSLYDLDVRRILADSPDLKSKCFFVIFPPTPLLTQRVERFGQALALEVDKFGSRLTNFGYKYRPAVRETIALRSVAEIAPIVNPRNPSDQDLLDLFELGKLDEGAMAGGLSSGTRYYLQRSALPKILEAVEHSKAVAVKSALGNGKTLLLREVERKALEQGYRVFRAGTKAEEAILEFEKLARLDGKILVVVDNYQGWLNEIRAYCQVKSDRAKLVVAARDSVHDVLYERLEDECNVDSIPEFAVNRLDDGEIDWFVSTLEQYGLWRSLAGQSLIRKRKFLSENCGGQIHGILLGLLESHDIGDRVRDVLSQVKSNPKYFEILASVFILNTLNQAPTPDMLQDFWGPTLLSSAAFRNNPGVRQLISFSDWEVRVKSAVVSEFVLRNSRTEELVPVLVNLARHAAQASKAVPRYRGIFRDLLTFSNVQRILPETGRLEGTIRYYEGVKGIEQASRSPLFWLQYAIGCLVGDDLKRAKFYFDTAYALAEKHDEYNTLQIDNHFARYLLVETAKANLPVGSAVENFREARSIINRQLQHERLHYPFAVASKYQDFIDKFGPKLDSGVCNEVIAAAEYVLERISNLESDRAQHKAVRYCKAAMDYVITRCHQLREQKGVV